MKIEIRGEPSRFTATCSVGRELGVETGSATAAGPWVAGVGDSPDAALLDLYQNIGRAYVQRLVRESV